MLANFYRFENLTKYPHHYSYSILKTVRFLRYVKKSNEHLNHFILHKTSQIKDFNFSYRHVILLCKVLQQNAILVNWMNQNMRDPDAPQAVQM